MKRMSAHIILLMMYGLAASGFQTQLDAQAPAPDFSGTWELNRKLSSNHKSLSQIDGMIYIISRQDSALKVARTMKTGNKELTQELTYYTDGRGEKNPTMFGSQTRESKTSLSNGKLVSKYSLALWSSSTSEYYNQAARDVWELSKDGNTLTITTETSEVRTLPYHLRNIFKPETYRKVFKRVHP